MVKFSLSWDSANPGAMHRTIRGESNIPATAVTARRTESRRMADLANRNASSVPHSLRYVVKTGTKAILKEPSAKSRRSRLGMRKATKNASEPSPAPKNHAMTTSRTKPKIRLSSVANPIIPAAFVTRAFSDIEYGVVRHTFHKIA